MSVLEIKDGAVAQKYIGTFGTGTSSDPYFSIPASFHLEVLKGNVYKHTIVNIIGHKYALDTTEVVVAELDAADDINQSTIDATPATVKVSSSDADDTSAGAGVRTLTLSGLNSSGAAQSETITMNGQTAVVSSNTYSAILGLRALTWGATTWNEGTIYAGSGSITAGKPAVLFFAMGFDVPRSKGGNKANCAYYVVPASRTFYGFHLEATVGTATKQIQVHIETSTEGTNWITEEVFQLVSNGASISKPINALAGIVAGKHIRITAYSSGVSTNMSVSLDGILVQS